MHRCGLLCIFLTYHEGRQGLRYMYQTGTGACQRCTVCKGATQVWGYIYIGWCMSIFPQHNQSSYTASYFPIPLSKEYLEYFKGIICSKYIYTSLSILRKVIF
ncbi:hypothetical protein BDV38DRAFT_74059 [Aspergillus pseudotamarii]|uniref:Uncharacterized protein n=1 Tax=Aspergillus pseudotamarii TaxID=132259 RepID=A0A5N6SWV7_ASPPS|nr:uncharacterized protein BDV38DRAFT_74059 [Aspergillus pseudotamarii]KAE8138210.1 hypothetical protein BDV38DRAFT_74059 [Aspergillus pseudotamarii]